MWHRWSNLKNNWKNRKRLRDMFDSTYYDEAIAIILTLAVIAVLVQTFKDKM